MLLNTTELLAPPRKFMTSSTQYLSLRQQNFSVTVKLKCGVLCFLYALMKNIN